MKSFKNIYRTLIGITCLSFHSCEDLVEIGPPDSKVVSTVVFSNNELAKASVNGIYHQMFRSSSFSGGSQPSVTVLSALTADELLVGPFNEKLIEFQNNRITPFNSYNLSLWSSAYNTVYMVNAVLEGLGGSDKVTDDLKNQLEGEVRFVRAFTYFYLLNLYGAVPLISTTNPQKNSVASRDSIDAIYTFIKDDLQMAWSLLEINYRDGRKTFPNRFAAAALLARVSLYLEEWDNVEKWSTEVINRSDLYAIEPDLNEVFLSDSDEAIWQISPTNLGYTYEADTFVLMDSPSNSPHNPVYLNHALVEDFDSNDLRLRNWISTLESGGKTFNFAYKYKINKFSEIAKEYSTVLRLAEIYMIRAEGRLYNGDPLNALNDINTIRNRAGLKNLEGLSDEALMDAIVQERNKELFTEWGHRWLDLKRWDLINDSLSLTKPFWETTDVLYPIPEQELVRNPNMEQNRGY